MTLIRASPYRLRKYRKLRLNSEDNSVMNTKNKMRALIASLTIVMASIAGGTTALANDVTVADGTCQPYTLNGVNGQLCANPDGNDLFYPDEGDANCVEITEDITGSVTLCDLPDGSKGMVPASDPTDIVEPDCVPIPDDYTGSVLVCDLGDGSKGMVPRDSGDGGTPVDETSGLASCPDPFDVGPMVGVNKEALVRESRPPAEYCLFELRLPQGTTNASVICPDGWTCAIDTEGKNGRYYDGGNGTHVLDHKTPGVSWRLKAAYPATDPINADICVAMANEQVHVNETSPRSNFKFSAGNFTCEDTSDPHAAPSTWTVGVCPPADQAKEVARTIGGRSKEWKLTKNDDGDLIWKRQRASTPSKVKAPWGTLDVWPGHAPALMGVTQANKAYEMTWNCGQTN